MATDFSRTLSLLRQEKGISQRKAAGEMGISQALLSHYENGIREPGLAFVVKACDYYHVSADYLLGADAAAATARSSARTTCMTRRAKRGLSRAASSRHCRKSSS